MALFQTIPLPAPSATVRPIDTFMQTAMFPSQLKAADLKNALDQVNLDYAPQKAQADIGLTNAQASHYPFLNALTQAQTQAVPSEIALRMAQASHYPFLNALTAAQANYENQLPGFKNRELDIDQQKANQMGARFGKVYQLTKMLQTMSPPARAAYIANNPDAYNDLVTTIGNQATTELISGPIPPSSPNSLSAPPQNTGSPNAIQPQNVTVPQNQNALSQTPVAATAPIAPQATGIPLQQPAQVASPYQPAAFMNTPQTTSDVQKASEMYTNKQLTTNKTRVRAEGGAALENMMQSPLVDDAFNTLSQYSGIMGQAKGELNRYVNPKEYARIQSAQEQIEKVLAGSIGTLEGYPTSDFGAQQGLNFFRMAKKFLPNDPAAAMDYFNKGRQILRTEAESVQKAANPVYNVDNLPSQSQPPRQNFNATQLNAFAEDAIRKGAPREQVMAKLRQMQGGG